MSSDGMDTGQEAATLEGVMAAIQDLAASTGEAQREQARQTELISGAVGEILALLTPKEANSAIKRALRRRLVVVGACIGTDAHTVGIDAILKIKGFAGEKGLEYYREVKVVNLGAQVSVPELVEAARTEKADAVLVSQVVTQRDAHLLNTREMSAAFRES